MQMVQESLAEARSEHSRLQAQIRIEQSKSAVREGECLQLEQLWVARLEQASVATAATEKELQDRQMEWAQDKSTFLQTISKAAQVLPSLGIPAQASLLGELVNC
jgi:hypothetical protein